MTLVTLGILLLALGATCVVLDLSLGTEFVSLSGWLAVAAGVAVLVPAGVLASVLAGAGALACGTLLHVYVLRSIGERAGDRVAPDRFLAGAEGLAGKSGVLRLMEGGAFVQVEGDLWPLQGTDGVRDGSVVDLLEGPGGELLIRERGDRA